MRFRQTVPPSAFRLISFAATESRVDDLDQVHIPDPVAQELCRLEHQVSQLRKQLEEQENTQEID